VLELSFTREAWLNRAVELLSQIFTQRGFIVPRVRVSCGFPSTGLRSRAIGQCWSSKSSADGVNQIFISPELSDPIEVLDTLTHELVHAVDNCEHSHGPEFKNIALAVGLEGNMRQASAGADLLEKLKDISKQLRNYPHAKLKIPVKIPSLSGQVKAKCGIRGYTATPLKKFRSYGPPICPRHRIVMDAIGEWPEDNLSKQLK